MDHRAKPGFAEELAAALDWWREAGIDCDFADQPTNWLPPSPAQTMAAQQRQLAAPAPPAEPTKPAIDRAALPQDLAAFAQWWMNDPMLDDGRVTGRVHPRGSAGAAFMVIVPDPEREDDDRLLAGVQGRLLDAMLAAMGIASEDAYVASVLPRHMPMADWPAIADKGFGAILRHHVGLVSPKRLIVLGGNILPLLSNDPAHTSAVLREFNHEGLTIPVLAGKSLSVLLERPRWKAGLWQAWLEWSQGLPDERAGP